MACGNDYSSLSLADRSRRALTQLEAAGYPSDLAVAIVAISRGEVASLWLIDGKNRASCGCVVKVGLEPGQITNAAMNSPGFASYLVSKGWWTGSSPAGSLDDPMSDAPNVAFEWAVSEKDATAVHAFSVGPTQMNMVFFQNPKMANRNGWPNTWEELWDLYVAGSETNSELPIEQIDQMRPAYFLDRWLGYLTPKRYGTSSARLAEDTPIASENPDTTIDWLVNQAGSKAPATVWYHKGLKTPEGVMYRRPYKDDWLEIRGFANAMGYTSHL